MSEVKVEIVKGKKATYRIWSELVTPKDGSTDIDVTVKFIAVNDETEKIIKSDIYKFNHNVPNSTIREQIELLKKEAENDFVKS